MTTPNLLPQRSRRPPLTQSVLPQVPPFDVVSFLSAYNVVVAAENDAVAGYQQVEDQPKAVKDAAGYKVIASRVIGFLFPALWNMRHCLGDTPISRLATEVVSANGKNEIYELGRRYIDHLICSFRTTTPVPPSSNHPSCPSMDQLEDMLTDAIDDSDTDHRSVRIRALARDHYHCMITNTIDSNSFDKHTAVQVLQSETNAAIRDVETWHILNESILQNIGPNDEFPSQRQQRGPALEILKTFGLQAVVERLMTDTASASGVHTLLNIVSLVHSLHVELNHLKLAFEPAADGEPNTYDIVFSHPARALGYLGLKNRVTLIDHTHQLAQERKFKQAGGVRELPLPEPRLLALHAVCVRVAHMSGATEALDELDREVEATRVLAHDGASANLLYMKLSHLAPTVA